MHEFPHHYIRIRHYSSTLHIYLQLVMPAKGAKGDNCPPFIRDQNLSLGASIIPCNKFYLYNRINSIVHFQNIEKVFASIPARYNESF